MENSGKFISLVIGSCDLYTLLFLLNLEILMKGTIVSVSIMPNIEPAIREAKFCCHGRVPKPKSAIVMIRSLTSAMCGFFNFFQ